jgi:hypothetical protein
VAVGLRKIHSDKVHNLFSSPHIIRVIKSKLRWEEHEAYKIFVEEPEGKRNLVDLGVDWRIMLKLILKK